MSMLHLLTLVATILVDVAHCFVLPAHSKAYSPEIGSYNMIPPPPAPFDQWSSSGTALDTFPLAETSGTFRPNDRSVYDPGVDNIPMSAILADRLNDEHVVALPANDGVRTDTTNDATETEVQSELLRQLREHIREDEDIAVKSKILLKILEGSDAGEPMPLVYVEEEADEAPEPFDGSAKSEKRSGRYYRRYPWKRQNTRYRTYESEQRYLCVPSRNDVLKLLIGLDEGRKGNHGRTVNFCNRKRPAKAIFSNIRFLG